MNHTSNLLENFTQEPNLSLRNHSSSSPMASKPDHLNFILIPFMAPGHTIPIINMAKLLANHGVTSTIILTNLYAARFSATIHQSIQSGLAIRLLTVRFPSADAGLPPGCESADTLPSHHLLPNFGAAINMLQQPIEHLLKNQHPPPACIISDKLLTWTADTCKNLQLPRVVFDGMNCFTQVVMHNLYISKIYESDKQPFVVPGLPDHIELTRDQLPGLFNPGPKHVPGFRERVKETEGQAYGVVVNTFEELEKGYVEEFRMMRGGRVWCVGPLSLNGDLDLDLDLDCHDECLKWLDSRKRGSVVYACLGSLSKPSPAQFTELVLGLEASNHPFVVVVKGEEMWKWIWDEGVGERTRDKGFFVRDWAPQVVILSHSGVGALLTHCGWNSILEGICAGLPMITWPLFGEQFLNEKLIVGILGIGVGVGAKGVVHVGEDEGENKVMRDGIKRAIERVMDEGNDGYERRKRAQEWGEMAKRSVGEGESSWLCVELFIQDIRKLIS